MLEVEEIGLCWKAHTRFTKVDLEFEGIKIQLLFSYQSYIQSIVCHPHLDAASNGSQGIILCNIQSSNFWM